jgi:hypothetical protein
VRCTTPTLMPHNGDDETSRRGAVPGEYTVKRRGRAVPNFPVRRGDGRGDGDGGDGGESYARRTTKRLTGGAGLPAGGSARERAAGRWGRLISERERGSEAAARARERADNGPKGRRSAGARGEAAAAWARSSPTRGERVFSFTFYFLIPISIFVSFPFEQFI